jgi:hypothetical protein
MGWVPLAEQKSTRRRVEFFPLSQFQIHRGWPRLVSAFGSAGALEAAVESRLA